MALQDCLKLDSMFYGIFHPETHAHPHPPHPHLFLRRVEAGDSSARIIAPAMEGNRDFWKQKLQHWGCPLFLRTWIHETVLCMEHMWSIHVTEHFRFQSGFTAEKATFGKASSPALSEKSCKIWLITDSYQVTMWYLFFSEVMWSHRHCGEGEDVLDVRLSMLISPLPCHCSKEKNLITFLWAVYSHSRKVTVPARGGLWTWAVLSTEICGLSALDCPAGGIFTCRVEEMNVVLPPSPFSLQANVLVW